MNISRIDSVLYLSEPATGQQLQNWYVVLCGSGFPGKLLLLYVHEFPQAFIEKEMSCADDYIIGKTSNKSMLAHINQMDLQVTTYNLRYANYEEIDTAIHEDIFMDWFYKSKGQKGYQTALKYWMKQLGKHPS